MIDPDRTPIPPTWKIGDPVDKRTGYRFPGWVVAVFQKRDGQWRLAVEDDRGSIHIFNSQQLEDRLTPDLEPLNAMMDPPKLVKTQLTVALLDDAESSTGAVTEHLVEAAHRIETLTSMLIWLGICDHQLVGLCQRKFNTNVTEGML